MTIEIAIMQIENLLAACDHYRVKLDELERENAELREKNDDWENAALHAREHRCSEQHCTCVVPLLGKINQLERENAKLRAHAEKLGDANDRLVVENAALEKQILTK